MSFKYKIGFIGCGNMAKAIISGVRSSGIIGDDRIIASKRTDVIPAGFESITITNDNNDVVNDSEIVFLAIKPQVFASIGRELLSHCNAKYVVSMMAGTSSDTIASYLKDTTHVIRIMPNTPCKIGKGVTAMQNVDINETDKNEIISILSCMGDVVLVGENDFDAVVAVSGSGPAYAFMFIRALIDGGVAHGLDYATAKRLAIGMVVGAAHLAETGDDLDSMIDAVCSKGGTTIEAVNYYKDNGLEDIIKGGMDRCYDRSKELSHS